MASRFAESVSDNFKINLQMLITANHKELGVTKSFTCKSYYRL